jgi:hypothetical protein
MEKFSARKARKFTGFMTAKEEAIYRIHNAIRDAAIEMRGSCKVEFKNFCHKNQMLTLCESVAKFLKREGYEVVYAIYNDTFSFKVIWAQEVAVGVDCLIKVYRMEG